METQKIKIMIEVDVPRGLFCFGCKNYKIEKLDKVSISQHMGKEIKSSIFEQCNLFPEYEKNISDENSDFLIKRIRKCKPCKDACRDRAERALDESGDRL